MNEQQEREMREAREAWWCALSRKGDPFQALGIVDEAFRAGWQACALQPAPSGLTDANLLEIARSHCHGAEGGDGEPALTFFRDDQLIALGRDILAAAPVAADAAAPSDDRVTPSDFERMTPNQKRALSKGLAALETMADLWNAEVRLSEMAARIAAVPDESERAKRIAALITQGFIEGAYRHFLDHKEAAPAFPTPLAAAGLTDEQRTAIATSIEMLERRSWSNDCYLAAHLRALLATHGDKQ